MIKIKQKLLILLVGINFLVLPNIVNADSYSTTTDLFENSYTNNLIDMSQTQIDNISNKKYAIIQIDYDYYMFISKKEDVSVSGNTITMKNTSIIRCRRTQSGYSSYYDYSTKNESTTTIYANDIIVSNIDTSNSVSGKRFEDYRQNNYNTWLLVFILGLVFAIFLTKERSY